MVKSVFQVGQFDIESVKIMKKIAQENGLLLKEHNCDYLNLEQIHLRRQYGINAINIAPEFGVIQSNLLYNISKDEIIFLKDSVLKQGTNIVRSDKIIYKISSENIFFKTTF